MRALILYPMNALVEDQLARLRRALDSDGVRHWLDTHRAGNRIYFGSGYYGIRSASLGYFGKEPKDLDALESAAIVGCIKNPTNLSPLNNPAGNQHSRNLVLGRMVDLGALRSSEAAKLRFRPILMTAFAFILGVTPLLTASGAGAEGRKVMGMTVFAGMLIATILGVLLIPALFVAVSKLAGSKAGEAPPASPTAPSHGGGH